MTFTAEVECGVLFFALRKSLLGRSSSIFLFTICSSTQEHMLVQNYLRDTYLNLSNTVSLLGFFFQFGVI